MGFAGGCIGVIAAFFTMHNLQYCVDLLSSLQGYEIFNQAFYGLTLPSTLSATALWFVVLTTLFTSIIAGLIPAIQACRLNPATILRSE